MTTEARGRRLVASLGGVVVLVCAGVGFLVGANASERQATVEVVGGAALPATPTAFALYGALLATAVVVALFVAIVVASRFEAA